jgi:hypothetical protein
MDEKRIEDLLKKAWGPEPPDGMRERVLRKGREALAHKNQEKRGLKIMTWRFALATLGILVVLLTNTLDYMRHERLTAMMGGSDITFPKITLAQIQEYQREIAGLPAFNFGINRTEEDDSL